MVDILWSQLASLWIQSTLTLPPPEIAPIPGSAPFLKMAQIFSSVWFCAKFSTEEEKILEKRGNCFSATYFGKWFAWYSRAFVPFYQLLILKKNKRKSFNERSKLYLKLSLCDHRFQISIGFGQTMVSPPILILKEKNLFFQTLIRQVAGRGRTHWECRCARRRPIGHLSYLKTTTGINRTFSILQNSMPHVQLLLASRLAEDEERQLRAAIERVIRIFKSRLFQVRN